LEEGIKFHEGKLEEDRKKGKTPKFVRGVATRCRASLSEQDSWSCSWLVSSQVPDPCKRQATKRAKAEG